MGLDRFDGVSSFCGIGFVVSMCLNASSRRLLASAGERGLSDMSNNPLKDAAEEPYREYWSALGQFIHEFSGVEQRLLALLHKISGLDDGVSGVLFSGVRIDVAKGHIGKLLEVSGDQDAIKRLERPLAQLAAINTIRNNIVHWGATLSKEDELIVSNSLLRPDPTKLKEFKVSPADLKAMCDDLFAISVHLLMEQHFQKFGDVISNEQSWAPMRDAPWLYKPPRQSHPKKNRDRSKPQPLPERPPQSSGA